MTPRLTCAILCLSALASAQGQLISPRFLAAQPGGHASGVFDHAYLSLSTADGENRGTPRAIKQLSMRRPSMSVSYLGRSYGSLQISVSEVDIDKMIARQPPTLLAPKVQVFQGGLRLPAVSGPPATAVPAWGIHFPFARTWAYSGVHDIYLQMEGRGGVLANGGQWGHFWLRPYGVGTYGNPDPVIPVTSWRSIPATPKKNTAGRFCTDASFHSLSSWAGMQAEISLEFPFRIRMQTRSYLTAPSSSVIHALGFASNPGGVDLGSGCERFHISGPMLFASYATADVLKGAEAKSPEYLVPWNNQLAGLTLVVQGLWTDSLMRHTGLTPAITAQLPAVPNTGMPYLPRRSNGGIWDARDGYNNPALRWLY